MLIRKQNGLWADGDVFREKVLRERENGKMTRILSGVDDITINGCNKNKPPMKEEQELVSGVTLCLVGAEGVVGLTP